MSQSLNNRPSDIDRSLAIFYHPLFQEITSQWTFALFRKNKPDIQQNYKHPQDFQMNFLEFIEFNLKVQKCLLPQFDLSNAFVSALNDWVKEITECFNYADLYSSNETDVLNLKLEIEKTDKESLTLPVEEYLQFIDMFKEHEAFKIVKFHITNEVFCKFLFDLCTTWCEFLDIELFVIFMFSIFLQISDGEEGIKDSMLKNTLEIENLRFEFFEEFERQKEIYAKQKKKNLRYYRAWCEWNYLRLNEMGENVILKLSSIFGEEEEDRIYDLVSIFEKAIDTINNEITSQMGKTIPQQIDNQQVDKGIKSSQDKSATIMQDEGSKLSQRQHGAMIASISPQLNYQESFQQLGESKDLIRQKLNQLQQKDFNQQLISQKQQILKQIQQDQNNGLQHTTYQDNKQQQFEVDYDERGNIVLKKIVKIPVLGKHINPQPKNNDQTKIYLRNRGENPIQNYQIDSSFLVPQVRSTSLQPNQAVNKTFSEGQTNQNQNQENYQNINNTREDVGQLPDSLGQPFQKQFHSIALSSRGSSRQKQMRNSFLQGDSNNQSRQNFSQSKQIYQNPLLEKESQKLQNQAQKDLNKTFQKEAIETHLKKGINHQSPPKKQFSPKKDIRITKRVTPGGLSSSFQNKDLGNSANKPYFNYDGQQENEQTGTNYSFFNHNQQGQFQQQFEANIKKNYEEEEKKQIDNSQKFQSKLYQFTKQSLITSPKFETSDNSVLIPEFLRNLKAKILQKEQINKEMNIFDKELNDLSKTDFLNEFSNSIYQTKRNAQLDVPKKVLLNPKIGADELRDKVNKSFDKGRGKIKQIEQILEPNYTIKTLPHPTKKNKQNQSKGERLLASPSKRFNQRDYQYEILLDDQLNKLKEISMKETGQKQQANSFDQDQPNQNQAYKRAVDRYKHVWKKYLSESDMYMLNDWDSLYKIIIILKRKFAQDHRENYLNLLNLDLASNYQSSSQNDFDDSSTQASGEHENRFVLDKEKFQKTIQKLLKRDERRKKRRRQKRKAKQNTNQIQAYDIFKEKRKKFQLTKFRSRSNKQLFKDVFLLPQISKPN
ncbi:hypothetical protein TTHERM_00446420 (macronuclear) [Tetrahymena thermophila SB210]|uniref:Uncharacterized protein n=1 Tax=Tetrahymena thermophila (strain SB210) TaxID=312017 RepID=I7MHP3_TETTS|nr:hypothetical protein TTHERM_00446420 [Tetrahymena thermophila SB210]EAS03160.1 hypothetical protein TTHERM_00446420 [Tetrahymena thermophila SB210]|eukprot:XP_001023405.1 hypothetical protein TTHERM_00446420 [Tetrahymena thermophila SB210]